MISFKDPEEGLGQCGKTIVKAARRVCFFTPASCIKVDLIERMLERLDKLIYQQLIQSHCAFAYLLVPKRDSLEIPLGADLRQPAFATMGHLVVHQNRSDLRSPQLTIHTD